MTINLLDIAMFERREHLAAFKSLRDLERPAFNPEPGGQGFYSLTRYDHVVAAARDHGRFISGKGTQIKDKRAEGTGHPSVHNADPPVHGKLRAIGLDAFRKNRMALSEEHFRGIIRRILAAAPRGEAFDFVEHVAVQIPMYVFADVLGVPEERQRDLVTWANSMSDVNASDAEQAASRAQLFGYFRELVRTKRARPADDVATLLATAQVDGALLEEEALDAYFILLTVAGNETTRFLLSGGLEQLCRQPEDFARLRAIPALIAPAIEEMCRWVSPVQHMRRTATEDMDLFGTPIKAGDKVVLWFGAANFDERQFTDPDHFRIDRTPNPHIGFGVGAHFCIGAHLARIEARIFFEELFAAVRDIELLELGRKLPSNWFSGWTQLPVRWS